MAYEGYLVKVKGISGSSTANWDYVLPMSSIIYESYKATYSTLDEDAKRTGKGRLRRTTYPHKVAHCKFTFREMTNVQLFSILELIQLHYVKKRQKKIKASIWVPEINGYVEDYFYIPDTEYTIIREEGNKLIYAPTEFELIGY